MKTTSLLLAVCVASTFAGVGCTFFSGVEELELRSSSSPTDPSSDGGADGAASPRASRAPGAADGGSPAILQPGGQLCGAQGTWTACQVADSITTCADRCKAAGFTCVESCCAYDDLGDFAAKAGMVYATAGLTCELSSVPSTSSSGLCNDPVLPLAAGLMDVRCCCK